MTQPQLQTLGAETGEAFYQFMKAFNSLYGYLETMKLLSNNCPNYKALTEQALLGMELAEQQISVLSMTFDRLYPLNALIIAPNPDIDESMEPYENN